MPHQLSLLIDHLLLKIPANLAVFFNSTSQSESLSISQPFKDIEDQILEYEDIKA